MLAVMIGRPGRNALFTKNKIARDLKVTTARAEYLLRSGREAGVIDSVSHGVYRTTQYGREIRTAWRKAGWSRGMKLATQEEVR